MRAIITGLVACCVVSSSGEATARGGEWVVLRVERVEVAVARADGSPWDEVGPTGSNAAPDLRVRLAVNDVAGYLSPAAADKLVHEFKYEFLVPLEAVPPDGIAVEVFDQDGPDRGWGEALGTVRVTRADIADLLASSSRVKTFSDDSVTRLEVMARRYKRSSRKQSVTVGPRTGEARFATSVVAGEWIEVRASTDSGNPTIIVGVAQERLAVGRCTRAIVTSNGGITATLADPGARAAFKLRVLEPSLAMWTRGSVWMPCDGRRVDRTSVVAVSHQQTSPRRTSLGAAKVQAIVQARYLAGIQRCHERLLRTDPTATGRMKVRYTVGPTGGVVTASAKGLDQTVASCVESLVIKWRFLAPKDANGNPTSEDVEATLLLDVR